MGFFKRELNKAIKRSVNKAVRPKQKPAPKQQAPSAIVQMRPWSCPQQAQIIELDGDYENRIYVYNTEPLKGVRKGQTITVDIYRGDATLYSKHSGNTASSNEYDDVVVMYNNEPIGFAAFSRDKTINAAQMGYQFRMKAKCYGMLKDYPGVKEMKLIAPKPFYLVDWIPGAQDDRPIWEKDEYIRISESEPEIIKNLALKDKWVFLDAKMKYMPVEKGSQAKPHIGIFSNDEMLIAELDARRSDYKRLSDYMTTYSEFTVKATRKKSSFNDSSFYSIEILAK